jgi:hypothetical protein
LPLLEIASIGRQHRAIYEAIASADEQAAVQAFDAHIAYLDHARERALADQRPEDLRVAALTHEAHPEFERIRARVLERDR